MQNPLVSIIIPTYNRAHLIGETLDSVIAQTYSNWECIVVDDGSTDITDEVLKKYCDKDSRIQYHHRPADRLPGGNAARNYGFELCRGEYVNWFDDDDVMLEGFLKTKIEIFKSGYNFVICSGYIVDELLQNKKAIELNEKPDLFKDYVLWRLKVLTPSILFRKMFFLNKNLFSNKIKRGQETELFSRLFYKLPSNSYQVINKPLFLYRQHSNTKTTINTNYIKDFKESQTIIAVQNLKKSIEIKDLDLVNYLFHSLFDMFFRGLENQHKNNSKHILKQLTNLIPNNNSFKIEFIFLGNLFLILSRGSYRIEKRWNALNFNK